MEVKQTICKVWQKRISMLNLLNIIIETCRVAISPNRLIASTSTAAFNVIVSYTSVHAIAAAATLSLNTLLVQIAYF